MSTLNTLKNSSRGRKKSRRVGRGISSSAGKTCGRGEKGQGSRSGYKRRYGFEGGQYPLYRKLPTRGFTRGRFLKAMGSINLGQIQALFADGETVNAETLAAHGFIKGRTYGIKVLGNGTLTKKVTIDVDYISESALEKLKKAHIPFSIRGQQAESK